MLEEYYSHERRKLILLELDKGADLEHPVFGEGRTDRPLIMFIGEAPGKEEAASGHPFVGKAGKQLDEMLMTAGIARKDVFVTNAVKYRPYKVSKTGSVSNRTPSLPEVREGLSLLRQEIELINPIIIATLGNIPLYSISILSWENYRLPQSVGEIHGTPYSILIGGHVRKLFPLYHPAASIYNRELKPVLQEDLINLGKYARALEEELN